jgi:hypothetical protein
MKGYALAYAPYTFQGSPNCTGDGTMGDAQILTMGELAIRIDQAQVAGCAAKHGHVIPFATLLQMVVAHETAHRFGLLHYYRYANYTQDIPTLRPFGSVTRNEYARDPGNQQQIYSRLQIYPDPVLANAWLLGDLPDDKNYDLAGINISSYSTEPPGNPPPGAVDSAMRMQLSAPIGTNFNYIRVYQQQLQMMDYGPRWSAAMAQPGAWHFDPARDLDNMCVKCR